MNKIFLALVILTASSVGHAQPYINESNPENRVEGNLPTSRYYDMSENKWNAGITSGVNSPTGSQTSSAEFGVIIGMQPTTNVGTAIEANSTRFEKNNEVQQTNVLLRMAYTMGGDVPVLRNLFVGVGAGPVFIPERIRWAGAPLVGLDIPLSSKSRDYLSLGLEAKYIFVTSTDVPDQFASTLAVKYWF
jgi:hypothetical protein